MFDHLDKAITQAAPLCLLLIMPHLYSIVTNSLVILYSILVDMLKLIFIAILYNPLFTEALRYINVYKVYVCHFSPLPFKNPVHQQLIEILISFSVHLCYLAKWYHSLCKVLSVNYLFIIHAF